MVEENVNVEAPEEQQDDQQEAPQRVRRYAGPSSVATWDKFFSRFKGFMDQTRLSGNKKTAKVFKFDYEAVTKYSPALAHDLLMYPDMVLKHAQDALNAYDFSTSGLDDDEVEPTLRVRFIKLPANNKVHIRDLREDLLDKMVSVDGTVRNVTSVEPRLRVGAYVCQRCGNITYVPQPSIGKATEPGYCQCSDKKGVFSLSIRESEKDNYQRIKIQEDQEYLKGGEKPENLDINLSTDLTGLVVPGERITVNGILRAQQRQTKEGKTVFFDLYMDAVSIEREEQEFDDIKISPEEEEAILEASRDPKIYDNMVASVAPSIKGYDNVKMAILFQLFGGVPKVLPDGSKTRGDSHILLVGDPGIAKSYLAEYAAKQLAPRGVFVSGKSASGAGLTVSATKDEFDGQWVLEAGALVLADKGMCAVDEFDKMSSQDRSSLHEAMESQTISVAKAGIIAQLKCRASLLAAANPKYSRFDPNSSITSQIELPNSLLSRFDLIFILMDSANTEKDAAIAEHILNNQLAGELGVEMKEKDPRYKKLKSRIEPKYDAKFIQKYVAYAKRHVFPVMSDAALARIQKYYTDMRAKGVGDNNPIPVTARQLMGMVRLSEESARMRLSPTVSVEDTERAIKIFTESLNQTCLDKETGKFDAGMVDAVAPRSAVDRITNIISLIRQMVKDEYPNGVPTEALLEKAAANGLDRNKVRKELDKLKHNGDLTNPRNDLWKTVV